MSPIFNVAKANHQDQAPLTELWLSLYHYHRTHQPSLVKSPQRDEIVAELSGYLLNPECYIFIATIEEQAVGFVTGQLCQIISPLSKPHTIGSIDHWYVSDEWRGMGIGSALLDRIENEFADHGIARLVVEVWDFNQSALKTYKKRGFKAQLHCLTKQLT